MGNGSFIKGESMQNQFCILLTCIKPYSVLKTSLYFCVIFEWPLKTGFTVVSLHVAYKCISKA